MAVPVVAVLLAVEHRAGRPGSRYGEQPASVVDGHRIRFTQVGPADAPALALIHGSSASGRSWDEIVPPPTA
ncbi:hypothetical protein WEH80_12090 [Actinomycetes bacterium KLBMP 9759]